MASSDFATLVSGYVPEEIMLLRERLATAETQRPGRSWERDRDVYDDIKNLKIRCEANGHPLLIALTGKAAVLRLMRNGRAERRTCVLCGAEEVGKPANRFLKSFLFMRWKFENLNGRIIRTFNQPEWYLQAMSFIRQYSLPADVVLHHIFPPRVPPSLSGDEGEL